MDAEWHDALPAIRQRGRHPVPADRVRMHDQPHPAVEREPQRALPRRGRQGHQPVADREPAESEPLLLGLEVQLLGGALAFELALEVVEQAVPPHPAHDNGAPRHPVGLSTAAELIMDRFGCRWFTIDYAPKRGWTTRPNRR